jgi:hypothetical protein
VYWHPLHNDWSFLMCDLGSRIVFDMYGTSADIYDQGFRAGFREGHTDGYAAGYAVAMHVRGT